jgi:integral membrane sensor domain MASE1
LEEITLENQASSFDAPAGVDRSGTAKRLVVLMMLAFVYFAAGKIGLRFASINPSATAIWAPAGIALGACLLYGMRVWPAIFVGAFLVNATTAGSTTTSIAIAFGNTLEALLGAYLVNRFANGRHVFERTKDSFKFLILAPILSTTVASTIGVTSLCLSGYAGWSAYARIWLTWWLGDAAGDLLIVPLILMWGLNHRLCWSRRRQVETILLLLSVLVTGGVVFGGWLPLTDPHYPLDFLCLPVLLWAAFRFGPRETATVNFLSSCIAVVGTLHGYGPFASGAQNEALLLLQTYAGVNANHGNRGCDGGRPAPGPGRKPCPACRYRRFIR